MPRLTSSAWLGPERTAASHWGISSLIISDMVFKEFSSMPFARSTMICPSLQSGFMRLAVLRTKTDGTAMTRILLSRMASSRSAVYVISSGRVTSGRFLCLWVRPISSISSGMADHRVT